MESVKLTFEYTKDEYVRAERQYLFASKIITKTSVVALVICLLFSVTYVLLWPDVIGTIFLVATLLTMGIGCVLYFYIPHYQWRHTAKYHQEYQLIFSGDSIYFKTPTIDSHLDWTIYAALWENEEFYFLIQAPRMYAILPKRAFASPSDAQRFEEMAALNLKGTKRVL